MSTGSIRIALENALNGMTPALPTGWENASFDPAGAAWQEAILLFGRPRNSALGSGYHQENGVLQINLRYPANTGAAAATARAELLRVTFARGSSFTEAGVTVKVDRTPQIGKGLNDAAHGEWVLPVSIGFFADIFV